MLTVALLYPTQVWATLLQVALGLQYLHHNQVMHRCGGRAESCMSLAPGPGVASRRAPAPLLPHSAHRECPAPRAPACSRRDLKPQNILITEGGLVKLADLGIAQVLRWQRCWGGQLAAADPQSPSGLKYVAPAPPAPQVLDRVFERTMVRPREGRGCGALGAGLEGVRCADTVLGARP